MPRPARYCALKSPNGYFCTLPEGHTGPHIAEGHPPLELLDAWETDESQQK